MWSLRGDEPTNDCGDRDVRQRFLHIARLAGLAICPAANPHVNTSRVGIHYAIESGIMAQERPSTKPARSKKIMKHFQGCFCGRWRRPARPDRARVALEAAPTPAPARPVPRPHRPFRRPANQEKHMHKVVIFIFLHRGQISET